MLDEEKQVAVEAARAAGRLIIERYHRPREIQRKGPANLVTEVDLLSERLIVERLQAAFPEYGIVSEEGHQAAGATRWLIDPLDGTTNYAHGYPLFGVSIALEQGGETILGVVYNPLLDELFCAVRGQGATLNDVPLRVSSTAELSQALVGSGFPYDAWTNPVDNTAEWRRMIKRVVSARCDGSAALDLCFVAAGRLDAFWELDLEPWDLAAGALICQEAGGQVTLPDGAPFNAYERGVLASNGLLHEAMLAVLRG